MRKELKRAQKSLLRDLLDGAEVEPGIHVAAIREKIKGGKLVRKLKVR